MKEGLRSYQCCGDLGISLESDSDEGLESQSFTGLLSLSEFSLSWEKV